jgi:hypothetical protein
MPTLGQLNIIYCPKCQKTHQAVLIFCVYCPTIWSELSYVELRKPQLGPEKSNFTAIYITYGTCREEAYIGQRGTARRPAALVRAVWPACAFTAVASRVSIWISGRSPQIHYICKPGNGADWNSCSNRRPAYCNETTTTDLAGISRVKTLPLILPCL